jgi:hypothetical protein
VTPGTADRLSRWTRGAALAALALLGWAVLVPGGLFWGGVLAAGLVGSALATVLLMRSRSVPSLAQVITTAEVESLSLAGPTRKTGGAALRSIGERTP